MKIVCRTLTKGETLIKEMDLGSALTGREITEIRFDARDLALLVERLTSDSKVQREATIVYLSHIQMKFTPLETKVMPCGHYNIGCTEYKCNDH